jgi:hypothetical protein
MIGKWDDLEYIIEIVRKEGTIVYCKVLKEIGMKRGWDDTEFVYWLDLNQKNRSLRNPTEKELELAKTILREEVEKAI